MRKMITRLNYVLIGMAFCSIPLAAQTVWWPDNTIIYSNEDKSTRIVVGDGEDGNKIAIINGNPNGVCIVAFGDGTRRKVWVGE
jgi:hypothetical protein